MEHIFKGKERQWAKIIALTWIDEDFKRRFLRDPVAVLWEFGIEFPSALKINILEGKPGEINVTLPPKPDYALGSAEELEQKLNAPPPFWPYFRS